MKKQKQKRTRKKKSNPHKKRSVQKELRQLSFPKALRIAPSGLNIDFTNELEKIMGLPDLGPQIIKSPPEGKPIQQEDHAEIKKHMKLLANVGTGLWRLRNKMVVAG